MRKGLVDTSCVHDGGKLHLPDGCYLCLNDIKVERDKLRAERDELQALFDLQHSRVLKATKLWRKAHPGNELVSPDLGELITWLMNEATFARAGEAAAVGTMLDLQRKCIKLQKCLNRKESSGADNKKQLATKYTPSELQQANYDAKTLPFRNLISSEARALRAGVCSGWRVDRGWWEFKLTAPLEGIEIQVLEDASQVRFLSKCVLKYTTKTLAGVRRAFSKLAVAPL